MLTDIRPRAKSLALATIGAALAANGTLAQSGAPNLSLPTGPASSTQGPSHPPSGSQSGTAPAESGAAHPITVSTIPQSPIDESVPISINVDGRDCALVVVPEGLFDGQWTVNLTTLEIGGGGVTLRGRGRYPRGSLAEFDLAEYLGVLDGAVRMHVPEDATGFAALDYESGLLPWAERTKAIYKEGMTDEAFEHAVHEFFVESLRTAKAARPNVQWSYYGYPHWWESAALSERISDIYAESDAITPSLYIKNSGDTKKIRAHAGHLGTSVAIVQELHSLGEDLPVALYVTYRYSSVDKKKAYHPVTTYDFTVATRAARPWADQFVMWMGASSPAEAELLSDALAEEGRIRELVRASRMAK